MYHGAVRLQASGKPGLERFSVHGISLFENGVKRSWAVFSGPHRSVNPEHKTSFLRVNRTFNWPCMQGRILIQTGESSFESAIAEMLRRQGLRPEICAELDQAQELLDHNPDISLALLSLPSNPNSARSDMKLAAACQQPWPFHCLSRLRQSAVDWARRRCGNPTTESGSSVVLCLRLFI